VHAEFPRAEAVAVALGVALGVAGCGEQRAAAPVVREAAPVVHGELSPPGGIEDAVLLLRTELDGEELICSAGLVAENLVITARHCVSHLVRGLFTCTVQGELVSADDGAGLLGAHLPAESLEFYDAKTPRSQPIAHGESVLSTLSETICVNDVAFVVLDRSLELPVLPLRLGGRALRDEPVTLVGYGLDGAMSEGGVIEWETQRRTRNAGLVVAEVGPDSADEVTTAPPRTVVVEGPCGCLGDSGGPLLASGTGAVLGVYSLLGGSSCLSPDARHLFSHVPAFGALSGDAFARAEAEPTPEPDMAPEGGGGGESAGGAGGAGGTSGSGGRGASNVAGAGEEPPPSPADGGAAGATTPAEPPSVDGEGGVPASPEPDLTSPKRPRASGCSAALPHATGGSGLSLGALVWAIARALRRRRRKPC
jgi:hypothetical protein